MKISGLTAALAILKIMGDNRVPLGGWLTVTDIAEAWKATGMRKSDIVAGIEEGIALSAFKLEQTDDGPTLQLLSKTTLIEGGGSNLLESKIKASDAESLQNKAAKRKAAPAPATDRRRKP